MCSKGTREPVTDNVGGYHAFGTTFEEGLRCRPTYPAHSPQPVPRMDDVMYGQPIKAIDLRITLVAIFTNRRCSFHP
jgi:hypothetical protein